MLALTELLGWIVDFRIRRIFTINEDEARRGIDLCRPFDHLDRALDFVAYRLFVYGLVALLVAQRQLMGGLLSSVTYFVEAPARSLKHMSLKPHRISSFLLIVGLMASVSLYPSIA